MARTRDQISYIKAIKHGALGMVTTGAIGAGVYAMGGAASTWAAISSFSVTSAVMAAPATGMAVAMANPVTATIVVSATLLTTIGSVAVQYINSDTRNSKNKITTDVLFSKIKKDFNKGGAQNLEIPTLDSDFVDELAASMIEEKNEIEHKPNRKPLNLVKITIDTEKLTHGQLRKLLKGGIGDFQTTELNIINTQMGNNLVQALHESIVREGFDKLETLCLENNALCFNSLSILSKLGSASRLKVLDLSGNKLLPGSTDDNIRLVADFFKHFHQNFPTVTELKIKDIYLSNDRLHYLLPLFERPGMLKKIDISGNALGARAIAKFLKDPSVQNNINVREIKTGFKNKTVVSAIKARDARLNDFYTSMNLDESGVPVPTLLKQLASNQKESASKHLNKFFIQTQASKTDLDKWILLAEMFSEFESSDSTSSDEMSFTNFQSTFGAENDFITTSMYRQLRSSKNGQKINLTLSRQAEVLPQDTLESLTEVLGSLQGSEQRPIFPSIALNNLRMNVTAFRALLAVGLGDYQTKSLSLADNSLTDAFFSALEDNDQFGEVQTLNLSNNKITVNGLSGLAKFCNKVGVQELNISGNLIRPSSESQMREMVTFFRDLHKLIPTLKKLDVSNIGLNAHTAYVLEGLFKEPGLLETLNISENISVTLTVNLLKSNAVKNNVSIHSIITGHEARRGRVRTEIQRRNAKLEGLYDALNINRDNDTSITVALLQKLSGPESANAINELSEIIDNSELEEWQTLSRGFAAYRTSVARDNELALTDEADFIALKRLNKSVNELILDEELRALADCDENANINLSINIGRQVRPSYAKEALNQSLVWLRENEHNPVIENLALTGLKLEGNDFQNLLENGLGDWGTKCLELSELQVNDGMLSLLAEYNQFGQVKTLNLSHNNITSKGLESIVTFCQKVGVEHLNLSKNPLAPQNQAEINLLSIFCRDLHKRVPSLKTLNLSHVGLNRETILLVRPLLNNLSFLSSLDINQVAMLAPQYQSLISTPEFQSNVGLTNLNLGNRLSKNVRTHLNTKAQTLESMGNVQQNSVYEYLLKQFMRIDTPVFSDRLNSALDGASKDVLSARQMLKMTARHLKYFRDKVVLRDRTYQFQDETLFSEVVALKTNTLTKYWAEKIQNLPLRHQETIDAIRQRQSTVYLGNGALNACEMLSFQDNDQRFKLFYAVDDSFRVVNLNTKKQFVMPRYKHAIVLQENMMADMLKHHNAFVLYVAGDGDIVIKAQNRTIAEIKGVDIKLHQPGCQVMFQPISFHLLERVATMQALSASAINPVANNSSSSSNAPAMLPQYTEQQRAASVSRATSSDAPVAIQNGVSQINRSRH